MFLSSTVSTVTQAIPGIVAAGTKIELIKDENLAFAGAGKKSLYIVGRGAAYRIATQTAGYTDRAK
jgi:hypothetical protein